MLSPINKYGVHQWQRYQCEGGVLLPAGVIDAWHSEP